MIYSIYRFFKDIISGVDGAGEVQLYNNQFNSVLASGNLIFIRFMPVDFREAVKAGKNVTVIVRIYVVSKILSLNDGSLADEMFEAHDGLCEDLVLAINGRKYADSDGRSRTLAIDRLEMEPTDAGWLVTSLDFPYRK